MPNHINSSASFGKRQEYAVIAELLRRGYDVYQTFVDDKGIDCIVRLNSREPRYIDIQVKARSKDCNPRNAWRFSTFEINNPRPNDYFNFYSEFIDTYWVIPSLELVSTSLRLKSGLSKGKYSVNFCNLRANGKITARPKFNAYKNRFNLLKGYTAENNTGALIFNRQGICRVIV